MTLVFAILFLTTNALIKNEAGAHSSPNPHNRHSTRFQETDFVFRNVIIVPENHFTRFFIVFVNNNKPMTCFRETQFKFRTYNCTVGQHTHIASGSQQAANDKTVITHPHLPGTAHQKKSDSNIYWHQQGKNGQPVKNKNRKQQKNKAQEITSRLGIKGLAYRFRFCFQGISCLHKEPYKINKQQYPQPIQKMPVTRQHADADFFNRVGKIHHALQSVVAHTHRLYDAEHQEKYATRNVRQVQAGNDV